MNAGLRLLCVAAAAAAAAALKADVAAIAIAPPCEGLCAAIQVARERVGSLERRLLGFGLRQQVTSHDGSRIAPNLDPVSDPRFFGPNLVKGKRYKADYPADGRPTENDHFGYPFPKVNFDDRDFVKDDNDDRGEWKANNRYDEIRVKLGKARLVAEKAEEDVAREKRELAVSKEAEGAAEAEADMHGKAADEARAAMAENEDKSKVANETVAEAERLVIREVTTLADCKEQLAKARQHLEALLAEKNARDLEKASADSTKGTAEANELSAEEEDERLARRVAEENEGYNSAEEETKVTAEDVKKTEAELEAAAQKLKRFRSSDYGPEFQDGGVYGGRRSGGRRSGAAPRKCAALFLGLAGILAAA